MERQDALRLALGLTLPSPGYMRWRYDIDAGWKVPFYYLWRWFAVLGECVDVSRWSR